jgi:hypothetical protein
MQIKELMQFYRLLMGYEITIFMILTDNLSKKQGAQLKNVENEDAYIF